MRSLLPIVLLLLPLAADGRAQEEARADTGLSAAVRAALDVEARELPRVEPGPWSGWSVDEPPPEELRPALAAMAAAYSGGDLAGSVLHLHEALRLAPEYPPVLHQLGVVYFKLGRYGDAATCFERFLVHAPGEVGATRALGHAYYSLGRYAEAEEHYLRVIAAAPDQPDAGWGLALCALRLGETGRALELLDGVLAAEPDHAEAMRWKAHALFEEERTEEALPVAARARDLAPHEPEPWFLLARIHAELGEEEESAAARARFDELSRLDQEIRRLEASLELDPRQPESLALLARLRASAGDVDGTRSTLQRLLGLLPRDVEAGVFALDLLVELGDEEGAAVAAKALATNCAGEAEAWFRLERYYARLRDRQRQIQAGSRARQLEAEAGGR